MVPFVGFRAAITSRSRESGVSMLEFAIAMPMLVVFAAGVIDIGIGLRREQVVHAAAKEGARLGAASGRATCESAPAAAIPCVDAIGIPEDAVDTTGKRKACLYIQNAGLDLSAWTVLASVDPKTATDPELKPQGNFTGPGDPIGDQLNLLRVTIQSSRAPCFLCMLGEAKVTAQSVFVLTKSCA